jgi:UDP-N-acetylglucosamine:LPS N-acetylglucosamine transferase
VSRFLLLSASMGAGHDAACAELARRLHGAGHETVELDVLSLLPGPIGGGLRGFYHLVIRRAPFVYSGIYAAFFRPGDGPRPGSSPLAALAEGRLLDAVARTRSDAVVSLFHLAAQLTGRARTRGRLAVPCAALVTDFAVHRQWLNPGNDLNLCLTEPSAQEARRALDRPAAVYGPLVPGEFRPHPPGAAQWRERLGGHGPVVVMSAGAWGTGSGFAQTAAVLRREGGYHPVVLCGRDERLRRSLSVAPGATALGWVQDMPGLLAASAALLDNAAGQTALQALAVGVPVIGWRAIPGHGLEGVRRMAQLGLSDYATSTPELLQALGRLVPDGAYREQRIEAGRRLGDADAVGPLESMLAE